MPCVLKYILLSLMDMLIAVPTQCQYALLRTLFKQAIHLSPDDAIAYYSLGNTYAENGLYDRASQDYTNAII